MAQRDVATFKATKNARYTANTTGDISSADGSDMFEDTADSFLNITDNFIDEDSFASDSATKVPSQQSVKAYVDAQLSGIESVELFSRYFDDFNTGPAGHMSFQTFNDGGGAGATALSAFGLDNTEKCSGVRSSSTSTSTAGGAGIVNVTYTHTFGFGFAYRLKYRAALSALSDGTDTYTVRMGFCSHFNVTGVVDGAYFRYTHGTNSGKWEAVTVSNSTETVEDTTIAAEASIFHTFEVRVNSDATQVDFYIDGVKTNDITTNIINSSSRLTGQVATIIKTAGSTARLLYCDYYEFETERTTAR